MYAELSTHKIVTVLTIVGVLFAGVASTALLKNTVYGHTPPFASILIAFDEVVQRTWYLQEKAYWRIRGLFVSEASDRKARAIPVLTYHRIVDANDDANNVTTAAFRDQMHTLKRAGWETITLAEYEAFMRGEIELPERSFLVTFDDGAKESFYPVDPLFDALGYEGVIYIIAAAAHIPESTYYLSPTEIKRLLDTGRWEIGSHSFDGHRVYAADSEGREAIFFADLLWLPEEGRLETEREFIERVRSDLARARTALESTYGVPVDSFAFPLGNETGIWGANNFPRGAGITEGEASRVYGTGFLQTNLNEFSYNYPGVRPFIGFRIHVDYDWDGERLLQEMEQGLPKDIPYEDDFSTDKGWIQAWGDISLGRNNLSLRAREESSSASAFLDGTRLWEALSLEATLQWEKGTALILSGVENAKTYDACAFSDGVVRIQYTEGGVTRVAAEKRDERIQPSKDARMGTRVRGYVIECTWNYESVLEAYDRPHRGGIGFQVWDSELGAATLSISSIIVRETP